MKRTDRVLMKKVCIDSFLLLGFLAAIAGCDLLEHAAPSDGGIERAPGIELVTDTTVYQPDDTIIFTITNHSDRPIYYTMGLCGSRIEESVNGAWRKAEMREPPGLARSCYRTLEGLAPGQSKNGYAHVGIPVQRAEKYRALNTITFASGDTEYYIVSNEFEIDFAPPRNGS